MSDDLSANKPLPPVSFWYILLLVCFSLGTSAVSYCSKEPLQLTLRRHFTDSTLLIGFVTALQSLNQLWVTPYAAWKSDRIWTRIGRRKPLVLVVTPVLALFVALVPHCPELWMLIPLVFFLQMAEDAELAVMAPAISDSVPDKQRPLAIGMWQLAANGVAVFVMSRFILKLMDRAEHWPYTIAALSVLVTGALFLVVMRERYVPPRPQEKFRLFGYGKDIVQAREHVLIYIICLFQPLFVLVGSWYFAILARDTLGLTKAQYGAAFSWGPLVNMIACIPLGYLFNRWRRRRSITMAACLLALVPTTYGLFFMNSQAGMAFFFAAQQFAFVVFRLNFFPYIMEYTTPRNVGTILGFTTAVNGMVRFTMVPLFGLLVDVFGKNYRLPLWGGYVGVAVCVAALVAMRPPEKVRVLIEQKESVGR